MGSSSPAPAPVTPAPVTPAPVATCLTVGQQCDYYRNNGGLPCCDGKSCTHGSSADDAVCATF